MITNEPASSEEYFVGVDLGGTNIKAVPMNRGGEVFCEESIPTESEKGPEVIIKKISSLIDNLRHNKTLIHKTLCAVGIAAAGVVDMKEGVCW